MLEIIYKILIFSLICWCFFARRFLLSLPSLVYWWMKDIKNFDKNYFREYGLRCYCGEQGAGKSIGIVYDLEELRRRYPKAKIYTNFKYKFETAPLTSLNDLIDPSFKNGTDGVIFVLDEIQNEFSSLTSKDFPESLLSQITQQRKQRVCILASSQVFTRVSKPLREQCFTVVQCQTIAGRYTRLKYIKAADYLEYADDPTFKKRLKLRAFKTKSFVQTDILRSLYDSYEQIKRLSRDGFSPKLQDVNITVNNRVSTVRKK